MVLSHILYLYIYRFGNQKRTLHVTQTGCRCATVGMKGLFQTEVGCKGQVDRRYCTLFLMTSFCHPPQKRKLYTQYYTDDAMCGVGARASQ